MIKKLNNIKNKIDSDKAKHDTLQDEINKRISNLENDKKDLIDLSKECNINICNIT